MATRAPIVAGQFYAGTAPELEQEIHDSFLAEKGPGSLPGDVNGKRVIAAIAPHAGYAFSGPCAAWSYRAIAEGGLPGVFIILGPNHSGRGRTSTMTDDWETPLGVVKADAATARLFAANADIAVDATAHRMEHSIEVQLPFLQFISREQPDALRIVPVAVGHDCTAEQLAVGIQKTIAQAGKKLCIIASSDFTHYGFSYGYVPFSKNIKENLYALDKGALDFIQKLDAQGFLGYVAGKHATICGALPIAALLGAMKGMATDVKLLQYYTSADIMGDYGTAVGYASVVFR